MNISRDFCILSLIRPVYLRADYFRHLSRQNRPFEINFFHEKIFFLVFDSLVKFYCSMRDIMIFYVILLLLFHDPSTRENIPERWISCKYNCVFRYYAAFIKSKFYPFWATSYPRRRHYYCPHPRCFNVLPSISPTSTSTIFCRDSTLRGASFATNTFRLKHRPKIPEFFQLFALLPAYRLCWSR